MLSSSSSSSSSLLLLYREPIDSFSACNTEGVQLYADTNNSMILHSAVKAIYGLFSSGTDPPPQPHRDVRSVGRWLNNHDRQRKESEQYGRSTSTNSQTEHLLSTRKLYKNIGAKSDCGNYRGISLLSIPGKILARIPLSRLITSVSESNLPEAQSGFRPGRSTIDMMFAVRQVKEKCIGQQIDLYSLLIDLTKAFNTVNRQALRTILATMVLPMQVQRAGKALPR